jgi:hypothetical protein
MNNDCAHTVLDKIGAKFPQFPISRAGLTEYMMKFFDVKSPADVQVCPDMIHYYLVNAGIPVRIAFVTISYGSYGAQIPNSPSLYPGETKYLGDPSGQILPNAYLVLVNARAQGFGPGHYYPIGDDSLRENSCEGLIAELRANGNLHRIAM